MTGPGTEELGAVNSYNGGTTLAAGVLQVWNAEALGTGSVTGDRRSAEELGRLQRTTGEHLYYVDPAGFGRHSERPNNGSIHQPFATLAEAYSVAGPGDTIILRGGTYDQADLGYSFNATGVRKALDDRGCPGRASGPGPGAEIGLAAGPRHRLLVHQPVPHRLPRRGNHQRLGGHRHSSPIRPTFSVPTAGIIKMANWHLT